MLVTSYMLCYNLLIDSSLFILRPVSPALVIFALSNRATAGHAQEVNHKIGTIALKGLGHLLFH